MKKLFFLVLLFLASAATAQAACTGSTPNFTAPTWADLALCHTAAAGTGDVITVTAGSYTVVANTSITKFVKIRCATALACILTDSVADVDDLITITESTAGSTRFEGFAITQGTGQHLNPNGVIRTVYATDGLPILITGNTYSNTTSLAGDFMIFGTWRGVVWDNTASGAVGGGTCQNTGSFLRQKNLGLTGVWTEGPFYGTADSGGNKNLYIEGNTITNMMEGIDIDANGRAVVRYNTITNSQVLNHGADTGSIAGRYIEIYENMFEWDNQAQCSGLPVGFGGFLYFRGGPALIHNNTFEDVTSMAWGDKNEVNFFDEKLRRNAGPWACWTGGYPSPYQVGWGYSTGGTQAGTSGVFQDLEGIYLWNNTGGGNYGAPAVVEYSPNECGGSAHTVSTYIQSGRDYFIGTAKPGYTAYTYPHPLANLFGAKTIYVNKAGSDGNSCTTAQSATDSSAKLTINGGIGCLAGSDTLIIGDGTYNEQILFSVIPAGSSGAPTIVRSENNRLAILLPASPTPSLAVINIDRSYITIDGLVVDATNIQENGAYWVNNISTPLTTVTIQNGVARNGIIPAGSPGAEPNGILLGQETDTNMIIRNMEIHNFRGHGIYNPTDDVVIENNYIHDWSAQTTISGYGIQFNPSGVSNGVVRGNRIENYHRAMVYTGDGALIYNNIFHEMLDGGMYVRYGATNAKIYFNTFYGNTGYDLILFNDSSGSIVTNNIFYASTGGPILDSSSGSTCTYNLGVSGGEGSSDSCSSSPTASDPDFVNAAIGDFHTLDTSPALGAGIAIAGITTDKDNVIRPTPPSMGPYEIPSGVAPGDPVAENFDSYSTGVSISGLNGGAGWTQSWTLSSGVITVETAGCSMSGKALRQNTANFDEAYRHFNAHTGSFSIFYKACVSTTSLGAQVRYRLLNEGGGGIAPVYFQANGNIEAADGTDLVTGFSANQAYQVEVNFDTANQPNKYRVKIDAGSYSAWFDDPAGFTSVAGFIFGSYATNAHTAWLDDISEALPAGGTITNVTPIAGAVCTSGLTCPISWGSNGITGAVNVYYLVGGNQYLIASPNVAATPYTWTVNAPAGTTIKTRVSQGAVSGDSGEFTVRGTKAVFAQ